MKLTITPMSGARIVRVFATIGRSRKQGTKRRQKTWIIKTVAPEHTAKWNASLFEQTAKKWEQKQLEEFAIHEPDATQKPA